MLCKAEPELTICRHSARHGNPACARRLGSSEALPQQIAHNGMLKRCDEIQRPTIAKLGCDLRPWPFEWKLRQRETPRLDTRLHRVSLRIAKHGGLNATEGKIKSQFPAQPLRLDLSEMKRHCARVTERRKRIDPRPSRISQPEQLGHLVIRFTRRVVHRPAHVAIPQNPISIFTICRIRQVQMRMPARDHQGNQRQLHRLTRAINIHQHSVNVPFQMIHRDQRLTKAERQRLRIGHSHQQRSGQSRAYGHGDRLKLVERDARTLHRCAHHRDDVPQVLPRCQLRNDAAIVRMQRHL